VIMKMAMPKPIGCREAGTPFRGLTRAQMKSRSSAVPTIWSMNAAKGKMIWIHCSAVHPPV